MKIDLLKIAGAVTLGGTYKPYTKQKLPLTKAYHHQRGKCQSLLQHQIAGNRINTQNKLLSR